MKVGDLIRYKANFQPPPYDLWVGPCLVMRKYPPPDDGLWDILIPGRCTRTGTVQGVINENNYEIEVINGAVTK